MIDARRPNALCTMLHCSIVRVIVRVSYAVSVSTHVAVPFVKPPLKPSCRHNPVPQYPSYSLSNPHDPSKQYDASTPRSILLRATTRPYAPLWGWNECEVELKVEMSYSERL